MFSKLPKENILKILSLPCMKENTCFPHSVDLMGRRNIVCHSGREQEEKERNQDLPKIPDGTTYMN